MTAEASQGSPARTAPREDEAIEISIDDVHWQTAFPAIRRTIEDAAHAAVAAAGVADYLAGSRQVSISFLLTDDAAIGALNRTWRQQDKPTNVLSFPNLLLTPGEMPVLTGDPQPLLLGDIALAYQTIESEASMAGIPLQNHLTHLVIHGVLHLLGYDHVEDSDAEAMEALEVAALTRMGIPNPYE